MERTSKGIRGQRLAAATIAALSGLPGVALAAREWNLQTPVTEIARQQYELHTFIFWRNATSAPSFSTMKLVSLKC